MPNHPAFADTVIDSLMGLQDSRYTAAPTRACVEAQRRLRHTGAGSLPRVLPTGRVVALSAQPRELKSVAPTSSGQLAAIGLMALVLMPAALLSTLMLLQSGQF